MRQFVADASHELRTPLTTIAGYTELARRRPDDPAAVRTALGKVEEESARMTSLVEDLLLLARLDSGRPLGARARRPVPAAASRRSPTPGCSPPTTGGGWTLPEESVEVTGDEQRLHQVVTNLLTNARKYTPAGTTVTVTGPTPGGFAVHDDGPGFPPDLADHAFERFARGDAARTRGDAAAAPASASSLVQAIVTAHGGTVTLRLPPRLHHRHRSSLPRGSPDVRVGSAPSRTTADCPFTDGATGGRRGLPDRRRQSRHDFRDASPLARDRTPQDASPADTAGHAAGDAERPEAPGRPAPRAGRPGGRSPVCSSPPRLLYLWGLGRSGWANSFYSAAAQAGSESWKAFFFGSSDAASSHHRRQDAAGALADGAVGADLRAVVVEHPRAAGTRGRGAVWLLHATVRRTTGSAVAGLLAGAVMALTPVAVLMFRFNNPDAMLCLLLVGVGVRHPARRRGLGARRRSRAGRWLALAGVLVGLRSWPRCCRRSWCCPRWSWSTPLFAGVTWRRRLLHLLAAAAGMVVAAGWWIAIVSSWPAASRPYIGGSQHNSILELTLGYNGFGRLDGSETGSVGGGARRRPVGRDRAVADVRHRGRDPGRVAAPGRLVLGVAGLWFARGRARLAARRADALARLAASSPRLTFSLMAGIFHPYYTVALAPAIGAWSGSAPGSCGSTATRWPRPACSGFTTALTTASPSSCWRATVVAPVAEVRRARRRLRRRRLLIVGVRHLPRRVATAVAVGGAASPGWPAPAAYSARDRGHSAHRLDPERRARRPAGSAGGTGRRPGGGRRGWQRRNGSGDRRQRPAPGPAPAACSTAVRRAPR